MMQLNTKALIDFQEHARQVYPNEAVGVLVRDKYLKCENTSETPGTDFVISAKELLKIELETGPIQAVLHSHPYDLRSPPILSEANWPSHQDMVQWIAGDIPWGIAGTDGTGFTEMLWLDDSVRPPLENRVFIHGVSDCYSIIRDYYLAIKGINLPNYPRQFAWWDNGLDHYVQNFEAAGFKLINRLDVQAGDALLYKIRAPVSNHAAVVTGPDTILHQLARRPSCYTKRSQWAAFETHWLRFYG